MRRRSRLTLLAAGTAFVLTSIGIGATGMVAAGAEDEPGSGLGVISLSADANGQRFHSSKPSGNATDTGVPHAEALIAGPRSAAMASAAWPGALAGNVGSLATLLNPTGSLCWPNELDPPPPGVAKCQPDLAPDAVKQQYVLLNTPIRAEANNDTQRGENTAPGVRMVATADDLSASADAVIGMTAQPGLQSAMGTTRVVATVTKTAVREAVAEAHSEAEDISLFPGGLITIDSVTSTAKAVTTGTTGKAEGRTVVSGMKVQDIPVTVDGDGVHAAGQTLPVATDVVRGILAQAGIDVFITEPHTTYDKQRNAIVYDAGTLVVMTNKVYGGGEGFGFTFGGARVTAASTTKYEFTFDPQVPPVTDTGGGFVPGTSTGTGGATGGDTGFTPGTVGTGTGTTTTPGAGVPTTPTAETPFVATSRRTPLPGGLPAAAPVLAVLGAVFLAGAFRRLPDRVLDAPPATCSLGGES